MLGITRSPDALAVAPRWQYLLMLVVWVCSMQAHANNSTSGSPTQQVIALSEAYQELHWIAADGGWPIVPRGRTLEYGVQSARVATLRSRLALPRLITGNDVFGRHIQRALRSYQRLHGLSPDGIAGPNTLAHLNVSVDTRMTQILVNIKRWQALSLHAEPNFIWVNIPEFSLRLYAEQTPMLDMRVIVGKRKNPTPEMNEALEYLVFNPYWHVPKRISTQEILPKIQQDLAYLSNEKFDVLEAGKLINPQAVNWQAVERHDFNYRFRQRPGPKNALGTVKFIFPNPRFVYLHDTPSKRLFSRSSRAFSHGCVRVEDPVLLAKTILALQNGLSAHEVDGHMQSKRTKRINLDEDMPVYLTYLTAQVRDGQVQFFNDIYNRDRKDAPLQPHSLPALHALANP